MAYLVIANISESEVKTPFALVTLESPLFLPLLFGGFVGGLIFKSLIIEGDRLIAHFHLVPD